MRKRSRLGARFRAVTVGLATAVAVGMPVIVHAATSDTPGYSTTTIGAFNAPKGIALTPNGKALYVANSGNQTVSVVDTATKHITHTISDPSFSSPTGVAVAPDSAAAYVSNRGSGTVSKISTTTGKVVATIGTVNTNAHPTGVAITPDGSTAFVTEGGLGVVTVINLVTGTVTGTISVGTDPEGIAISPDGGKALVADHGTLLSPGTSVSVINVATKTVSTTITDASKLHSPLGIAFAPNGLTAYAANRGQITSPGNTVAVIDVASNTVTSAVTVANYPMSVTVTPDGARVYASTDVDEGAISVIDTTTKAVTEVNTSEHPLGYMAGIVTSPDGATVYVAAAPGQDPHTGTYPELGYGYTLALIDTGTKTVSGLVPTVGTSVVGIALSPDDHTAYVLARGAGSSAVVSRIDTATDVVTTGIFLSSGNALAASPDGKWVYVTGGSSTGAGSVAVIDTSTQTVTGSIPVGTSPQGVAFAPNGAKAYVANIGDGTVSVINTATQLTVNTINVRPSNQFVGGPIGVTVSHDGTRVYVSNGAIIDTATANVSGPLNFNTEQVQGVATSPTDKTVYAVQGGAVVRVVNAATGALTSFIVGDPLVPDGLTAIAISANGATGYLLDQHHDTMLAVDLQTHKITGTVHVGETPVGLDLSTGDHAIYVANGSGNSVSAITTPKHLSPTPTPTISGRAKVGKRLTARAGTWGPGNVTLKYHWYAGGKAIANATKATLKLTTKQKGKKITVRVTGSKTGYITVTKTSKATAAVKR